MDQHRDGEACPNRAGPLTIPALSPGERLRIVLPIQATNRARRFTLLARIDHDHATAERDVSNNTLETTEKWAELPDLDWIQFQPVVIGEPNEPQFTNLTVRIRNKSFVAVLGQGSMAFGQNGFMPPLGGRFSIPTPELGPRQIATVTLTVRGRVTMAKHQAFGERESRYSYP